MEDKNRISATEVEEANAVNKISNPGDSAENQLVSPEQRSETPKSRKKIIALLLLLVFLVAGGAIYALLIRKPSVQTSINNDKPAPAQSVKAPKYASSLVFQSNSDDTSTILSITDLNGDVKHSLKVSSNSASYSPVYADSGVILLEGDSVVLANKDSTAFTRLGNDGKAQDVPAALTGILGGSAHVDTASLSHVITSNGEMFGIETSPKADSFRLVALDLSKGTTSTLLSATLLAPKPSLYGPIQILNVSADDTKVYVLASNAQLSGSTVPNFAILTVEVKSKKFTVNALPDTFNESNTAVSKDGKFLAYYTTESDGKGYSTIQTHILNVATQKDTVVDMEGLGTSGGSHDISFSPDGAYVSVVGRYAADAKKAGMALQVISVASKKIVHQVDLPGVQNIITSIGWSADDSMLYTNNSSTTGVYDTTKESAHSYNPVKDKTVDYPASLGRLISVLNYYE
ncbi:MAG TPA: hypothetical protein VLG92_01320 [Candidatus Saccharimonadia bacterium]|nr:hypothetical protein [Candidatus Saccharimonadia bacterium]